MLLTSVLLIFILSSSCTQIEQEVSRPGGGGDGPPYDVPPFPSETTCYFFVPCFTFPTTPICSLPKNLCGGAYTFANSCYLSFYNCEHPSNEYYQYSVGECYSTNNNFA
ncbi:hypothetical protein Bhyg_07995 [Pseudolycoriella hygida]|uniref:Kazal-like domain-containing protein n=1 Tax=Pseudolycoriella hygida TaxID=35572 RepID=A0A9Q0N3U8_9DIPT|nr:hypothetical protein Bhyg_07995 [Pseudolycoriella hygida]